MFGFLFRRDEMKTHVTIAILFLLLLHGCASTMVQQEDETTRNFFEALHTLGFRGLYSELPTIIRVGEPASTYANILKRAHSVSRNGDVTWYEFWPQPEKPRFEFDYWIEIGVDETNQTIKFAHPNKYIR